MSRWLIAAALFAMGILTARAEDPAWRTAPANVLVIYAADDVDSDGNGKSDSQDVAEYYAQRRGVPAENLLGLKIYPRDHTDPWEYRLFYDRLLKPVADKLQAKAADGKPFARHISYLLLCPGIPMSVNTHHVAPPGTSSNPAIQWFAQSARRTPDQFLISLNANVRIGVDAATGGPGNGEAGMLGSTEKDLELPYFQTYITPGREAHFRQLRQEHPAEYDFYLTSRLGLDMNTARDMIDGALYAERYLHLPAPSEPTAVRPAIWLDQKYNFAGDHVAAMSRCVAMVQGMPGTAFAQHKGLAGVWPLVIDNQDAEVGKVVNGVQHRPSVSARIASEGVDAQGITLTPSAPNDVPSVLYFTVGSTVSAYPAAPASTQPAWATGGSPKGSALVIGIDVPHNKLLLDSVKGFAVGDSVAYTWPGPFPADDCFFFYGFYGLNEYEDVFQFLPGSMGIHVDSACMTWATNAMRRGIGATFGVIGEPLSAGIPYGDQVMMALSNGYDWAEANHAATRIAQRWVGVLFGDPLYAPFRSAQQADKTAPTLEPVHVNVGPNSVLLSVDLGGKTEDELADVALFKLEYGPTPSYGQTVEFFDWPQPEKSKADGRRFGYSRHFRVLLRELETGEPVHYRIIARDPAGNQTITHDATFTP